MIFMSLCKTFLIIKLATLGVVATTSRTPLPFWLEIAGFTGIDKNRFFRRDNCWWNY